jgi:Rieske Fe-S protein
MIHHRCKLCDRRSVLAWLLALPAVGSARAQGPDAYRPLREPVAMPAPRAPWTPAPFKAWLEPEPDDGLGIPLLLLNGLVLRVPGTQAGGDAVHAFCRLCPHEICEVDFVTDTSRVRVDSGETPPHPLFFCVCHESVFDPVMDGAHIGGPAPRGLYRFALRQTGHEIRITAVEAAVLTRLREGV